MPTQQNWFAPPGKPTPEAEWEWLFCLISTLQLSQRVPAPDREARHPLPAYPLNPEVAPRDLLGRLAPIRIGPPNKVDAA